MNVIAEQGATRRAEIGLERRMRMRKRIVTAARHVFAAHGIDMPVIDDFIAEARVGRGTFYNYFRTKEDLLRVVLEELRQERKDDEEHVRSQTEDQAERLVIAVRLRLLRARKDPVLGRLLLQQVFLDESVRRGPEADIRAVTEAGRFKVRDIQFATDLFFAMVAVGVKQALSDNAPDDLDSLVATSILTGLGMPYDEAIGIANHPLQLHAYLEELQAEPAPTTRQRRGSRRKRKVSISG